MLAALALRTGAPVLPVFALPLPGGRYRMVSGDTGPLHLAAAVGTPIVGLYGPTSPERNGPWRSADVSISRNRECVCHHQRRCHLRHRRPCIEHITVAEVREAIDQRLRTPR